jgi:hypothetical protein
MIETATVRRVAMGGHHMSSIVAWLAPERNLVWVAARFGHR